MTTALKYSTIGRNILKQIRGDKSQNYFNRKLGYTYNKVSRWEALKTKITWKNFLLFNEIAKVDILMAFKQVFQTNLCFQQGEDLIKYLIGNRSLKEVSGLTSISPFSLSRLKTGRSEVHLDHVLALMGECTTLFYEFLERIVDVSKIPEIKELALQKRNERNLTYEYPYLGAFLRLLELDFNIGPTQQRPAIYQVLGISKDDSESILSKLLESKIVTKKNDKFCVRSDRLDTSGDFKKNRQIKKYWLERSCLFLDELEKMPHDCAFGHNIFTIGPEGLKKIKEEYIKFFREVSRIIIASKEESHRCDVIVLGAQIFNLTK